MQELLGYTGLVKSSEESGDSKQKKEEFTALHDEDPRLKGDQDELPDFLQEEIIKKEASKKSKKSKKKKEPSGLESLGDYATPAIGGLVPMYGLAPGAISALTSPEGSRLESGLKAGLGNLGGQVAGAAGGAGLGALAGLLHNRLAGNERGAFFNDDYEKTLKLYALAGALGGGMGGGALGAHLGRKDAIKESSFNGLSEFQKIAFYRGVEAAMSEAGMEKEAFRNFFGAIQRKLDPNYWAKLERAGVSVPMAGGGSKMMLPSHMSDMQRAEFAISDSLKAQELLRSGKLVKGDKIVNNPAAASTAKAEQQAASQAQQQAAKAEQQAAQSAAKGEQQAAVGGAKSQTPAPQTPQTPAPQVPAPVPQQQGGMMDRFRGMTPGQQLALGGAGVAALGGGYALGRGTAPDPTIGNMTRYYADRVIG